MAKRRDNDKRRSLLPDPGEFYFDDDLDSVTRGLPDESDYLVQEEEEPEQTVPTEGISRSGATHHSVLVYDASLEAIEFFGRLLGLPVEVL